MKSNHHSCAAVMISNTLTSIENEDEIKIDWTIIKKILKITLALVIIFTIIFFTCFGCFLIFSGWSPQTVTLSSEGGVNATYPDSMGKYLLNKDETEGFLTDYNWYRHKDREDRFLMYNNLGKIKSLNTFT